MTKDERIALIDEIWMQEFPAFVNDLEELERKYGSCVLESILKTRGEKAERDWKVIAGAIGKNDIDALLGSLWTWCENSGYEFTVEREERSARFRVTKCPLAEMARKTGMEIWGKACYCDNDYGIVRGFNPSMKFTRTKTLMEGHDCCDHAYFE